LLGVLDRYDGVRAVLSGHNHRPFEYERRRVMFLGAPSTCRQAHHEAGRHAWTDEGPAVRSLVLRADGTIDHHVRWLNAQEDRPTLSRWD
jgi:3',5'-cyclic-AMP phosphodiesterase